MLPKLSIIQLDGLPILEQLQIEEALLRADDRNWCLINTGSPPALVMGISGKPELLINREKLSKDKIPLIRRFSGGGTVVVDSNTFFVTWIFNSSSLGVECCPHKIHRWSADLYEQVFPSIGFHLKENDYAIGEKKCGGNAQYICRGRWLHHTSFLWDYHHEMMEYLLMPAKTPSYRLGRSHHDFLCKLKEHIPEKREMKSDLMRYISKNFNSEVVSFQEARKLTLLPHRRATELIEFS